MNKRIKQLARGYTQETMDNSERVDIIKDAALILHAEAATFFLQILSTSTEGTPLTEVLNILEVCNINEKTTYLAIGEQIRRLIGEAHEKITITFAVKAALNFRDVPGMYDAILTISRNAKSPQDARSLALLFAKRMGPSAQARNVLTNLLQDSELSEEASNLLSAWDT